MTEPTLHPECEPLAFLLGTWRGSGTAEYPTTDRFSYEEEVRFWHVGKAFLAYTQRTWNAEGRPMHAEMGYLRPAGPGRVEIVLTHPTGIVEVSEGAIDGSAIEVASTAVAKTSTAKEVTRLERSLRVEGDVMRYELRMAAVGVPVTPHLRAELRRAR